MTSPVGFPGNALFRLPLSSGDTLDDSLIAGAFNAGIIIIWPLISFISIWSTRRISADGPSNSSPWVPLIINAVGPDPFFILIIGTKWYPSGIELSDHLILRSPTALPSHARSMEETIVLKLMTSTGLMVRLRLQSGLHNQVTEPSPSFEFVLFRLVSSHPHDP